MGRTVGPYEIAGGLFLGLPPSGWYGVARLALGKGGVSRVSCPKSKRKRAVLRVNAKESWWGGEQKKLKLKRGAIKTRAKSAFRGQKGAKNFTFIF